MSAHPLAAKPAPRSILVHVPRLVASYYTLRPDPAEPSHRVAFGTSGHRGSSLKHSLNEAHILAVAQAVCEVRAAEGTTGLCVANSNSGCSRGLKESVAVSMPVIRI